ncbi:hypothetical protein GCM10010277_81660 [Streptomyces longisporoflavus]|nr:hypothetical protein GCM10010277_81660 [Streptomyces longisporoflavus]
MPHGLTPGRNSGPVEGRANRIKVRKRQSPWPVLAAEMTQQAVAQWSPGDQQERGGSNRPDRHTEPDSKTPHDALYSHDFSLWTRGAQRAVLSPNSCLILLVIDRATGSCPRGGDATTRDG